MATEPNPELSTGARSLEDVARCIPEPSRQELEDAMQTLWSMGLHPLCYDTLGKAAVAARSLVTRLRRDIAEPPPDVCEAILKRAGYYEMWARLNASTGANDRPAPVRKD